MGKSIDGIGRRREPPPLLILSMSLQPVIPWRVALQQSPTPLHRPRPASLKTRLSASQKTSNGKGAQLKLSQLRGSPQDLVRLLRFLRTFLQATQPRLCLPANPYSWSRRISSTRSLGTE